VPNNIISSAFVELFPKFNQKFETETAKQIEGSMKGAAQAVDKQVKNAVDSTAKHTGRLSTIIHNQFEGIAGPIAAVFAGAAAVDFFKETIRAASDLNETMTKTATIFGEEAMPQLEKFAKTASTRIGQSEQAALDAAATFGVFGKSAGLTGKNLAGFATQMVTLTSDMASFSNTTPEEAVYAVGAALRGETEPIRRYGVLLDDASLRQEALALGITNTTKKALTPQQRVLAVQALILKQTKDAQGDFTKTSSGLANQQRILKAQMDNLKDSIGQRLLPVMLKITSVFNMLLTGFRLNTGAGGALRSLLNTLGQIISKILVPPLQVAWHLLSQLVQQMRDGTGPGGALAAAFTAVSDSLAATVGWLQKNETTAKALGIAVGTLVVITKAHNAVLTAQTAIMKAGGLLQYAKQTTIVTTATKAWAAVTWLVSGALKAVSVAVKLVGLAFRATPIGFVITLIGLLVAGLIYAYKHSEKFRAIVDAVGHALKTALLATLHAVVAAFHAVVDAVSAAYDWVKDFGGAIVGFFADAGRWLYGKGKDFLMGFLNGMKSFLNGLVAWILRAPVVKVVAPWLYAAVWLATAGRKYLLGFLNGVAAIAKTVGTWLNNNVIKPVVAAFKYAGQWLLNAGKFLISGLLKGIIAYLRIYAGIAGWLWRNIGKPAIEAFKNAAQWLLAAGKQVILGLLRGIIAYLRILGGIAPWPWTNVGKPIVNTFAKALGWLFYKGRELIIGLLRGVIDAMKGIGTWLNTNVVQPIIKAVKHFFGISSPSKVFQEMGAMMIKGLLLGLASGNGAQMALKVFGSMPEALAGLVGKGIVSLSQLPAKALNALGSAASFIGKGLSVGNLDVFTYSDEKIQGSTLKKLQQAQKLLGGTFDVIQGSFSTRVRASAGTHRGGGVIDVDKDASSWLGAVAALRHVGFAAWHRDPSQGPWGHHIHAVEIGNPTLSPEAAAQVASYLRGGSGLAGYERGAWNILRDQLAVVHRGEMVAPAPVASTLRSLGSRGGGATTINVIFPNYVGDKDDLVRAIDDLKRHKRI
jgi:hypothetical protein